MRPNTHKLAPSSVTPGPLPFPPSPGAPSRPDTKLPTIGLTAAVPVLIGKPPAEFSLAALPLTAPPPPVPAGLPSELLERRPDIAAAERRMASANAQIGVAKAAYYPTINLGGAGGFESGVITTLLSGPSALWSLGGSAMAPIFDGGRRRANADQAIAA